MLEEVNGVVIGEIETREYYRFYDSNNKLIWDAGWFNNDDEAEKSFWEKFYLLEKFKKEGVEMRVWR